MGKDGLGFLNFKKLGDIDLNRVKGGIRRAEMGDNPQFLLLFDIINTSKNNGNEILDAAELKAFLQFLITEAKEDLQLAGGDMENITKTLKQVALEYGIDLSQIKIEDLYNFILHLAQVSEDVESSTVESSEGDGQVIKTTYKDGGVEFVSENGATVVETINNGVKTTKKYADDRNILLKEVIESEESISTILYAADGKTPLKKEVVSGGGLAGKTLENYEYIDGEFVLLERIEHLGDLDNVKRIQFINNNDGTETHIESTVSSVEEKIYNQDGVLISTVLVNNGISKTVRLPKENGGENITITDLEGNLIKSYETNNDGFKLQETCVVDGKPNTVYYDGKGHTKGIVIQRGETLEDLAKALGYTTPEEINAFTQQIKALNGKMYYGDEVIIPTELSADNPIFFANRMTSREINAQYRKEEQAQRRGQNAVVAQVNSMPTVTIEEFTHHKIDFANVAITNARDLVGLTVNINHAFESSGSFQYLKKSDSPITETEYNALLNRIIRDNPTVFNPDGSLKIKINDGTGRTAGKVPFLSQALYNVKLPVVSSLKTKFDNAQGERAQIEANYQRTTGPVSQGYDIAKRLKTAMSGSASTDEQAIKDCIKQITKENISTILIAYPDLLKDLYNHLHNFINDKDDISLFYDCHNKIIKTIYDRAIELGWSSDDPVLKNLQGVNFYKNSEEHYKHLSKVTKDIAVVVDEVEKMTPQQRKEFFARDAFSSNSVSTLNSEHAKRSDEAYNIVSDFHGTKTWGTNLWEFLIGGSGDSANMMNATALAGAGADNLSTEPLYVYKKDDGSFEISKELRPGFIKCYEPVSLEEQYKLIFGKVPSAAQINLANDLSEQLSARIHYEACCELFKGYENIQDVNHLRNLLIKFDPSNKELYAKADVTKLKQLIGTYMTQLSEKSGDTPSILLQEKFEDAMQGLYAEGHDYKKVTQEFVESRRKAGAYTEMGVRLLGTLAVGILTGGAGTGVMLAAQLETQAVFNSLDLFSKAANGQEITSSDYWRALRNTGVDAILTVSGMKYGKYVDDLVTMSNSTKFITLSTLDISTDALGTLVRDGEITVDGMVWSIVLSAGGNFIGYAKGGKGDGNVDPKDVFLPEGTTKSQVQNALKNVDTPAALTTNQYNRAVAAIEEEVSAGITPQRIQSISAKITELRRTGGEELVAQADMLQQVLDNAVFEKSVSAMYKGNEQITTLLKNADPDVKAKLAKEFSYMQATGRNPVTGEVITNLEATFARRINEELLVPATPQTTPVTNSFGVNDAASKAIVDGLHGENLSKVELVNGNGVVIFSKDGAVITQHYINGKLSAIKSVQEGNITYRNANNEVIDSNQYNQIKTAQEAQLTKERAQLNETEVANSGQPVREYTQAEANDLLRSDNTVRQLADGTLVRVVDGKATAIGKIGAEAPSVQYTKTPDDIKNELKQYGITKSYYVKNMQKLYETNPAHYEEILNSGLFDLIRDGKVHRRILYGDGEIPHVSQSVLDNARRLANGEDFIHTVNSLDNIPPTVKEGDVFRCVDNDGQVGLFVKSETGYERLNVSEEKFRKLFPPIASHAFEQGKIGDCWFVSRLDGAMSTPKGRIQIYKMFREDADGNIYVKLANTDREVMFPNGEVLDINGIRSTCTKEQPIGIQMIEQSRAAWGVGAGSDGVINIAHLKSNKKELVEYLDGGQASTGFNVLFEGHAGGFNKICITNDWGFGGRNTANEALAKELIMRYANDDNVVLGFCGSTSDKTLAKKYNLVNTHECTIKGYDPETQLVYFSNPHKTSLVYAVPIDTFMNFTTTVSYRTLTDVKVDLGNSSVPPAPRPNTPSGQPAVNGPRPETPITPVRPTEPEVRPADATVNGIRPETSSTHVKSTDSMLSSERITVNDLFEKSGFYELDDGSYKIALSDDMKTQIKERYGLKRGNTLIKNLEKPMRSYDVQLIREILDFADDETFALIEKDFIGFLDVYSEIRGTGILESIYTDMAYCPAKWETVFNVFKNPPSQDVVKALSLYKSLGYKFINRILWGKATDPITKSFFSKKIDAIASYIDIQVISQPITVKRNESYGKLFTGITLENGQNMDEAMQQAVKHYKKTGDKSLIEAIEASVYDGCYEAEVKGFMSTTLVGEPPHVDTEPSVTVQLSIDVPAGTKGVLLEAANKGGSYRFKSEAEFLFQRGSNISVRSIEYSYTEGIWLVECTISN